MKSPLYLITLALALSLSSGAQEPTANSQKSAASSGAQKNVSSSTPDNSAVSSDQATRPTANPQNPPPSSDAQPNISSARKETSAASADQAPKPASPKGTTVIGCLSGPDRDGRFELRSMTYRTGVEVMGPDALKTGSGRKVKLTGEWKKDDAATANGAKPARRFQATEVEVMSEACKAPTEQTPISKKKKLEQQEKQRQKKDASPDASSPK